jgi:sulfotransferase family protein
VWPNFLVIGVAKSGTTSLYHYLLQHPDVYLPKIKEPNFFAMHDETADVPPNDPCYHSSIELFERIKKGSVIDIEQYTALFSHAKKEKAIGEASTFYMYHPKAPDRIKRFIPNVKMVAILRNPIERSYSSHLHLVRAGVETREFKEALMEEPFQSENVWLARKDYYIRPGFYARQLMRYYEKFDSDQIQVFLYDDYKREPEDMLRKIFEFLEVDSQFKPNMSTKHNVSGIPLDSPLRKKSHLDRIKRTVLTEALKEAAKTVFPGRWQGKLRRLYQHAWLDRPAMDQEVHRMLIDIFREDILSLEDLLKRDLSTWLREEQSRSSLTTELELANDYKY